MRVAPDLLSVLLLGAMPATAHAAPATIEGSWSGSGIAKLRNRTDRVVCRVNFARMEARSFRVSALCETGDRRYEQSGMVTNVGSNRYSGWVQNAQFNQRGSVRMTQHEQPLVRQRFEQARNGKSDSVAALISSRARARRDR
jgi:hypothetical protein